jgi:transcription termination/antitermination protein NusG
MLGDDLTRPPDTDDESPSTQKESQEESGEERPTPVVEETEGDSGPPVEEAPIAGEGVEAATTEEQEETAQEAESEVVEAQQALSPEAPTEAPQEEESEAVSEPVEMPAEEGVQSADAAANVPAPTPEAPAEVDASGDGGPVVEVPAAEAAPAEAEEEAPAVPGDPFSGPGDWYVIHTYAGYENKVKTNLGSRIHTMQMEDKIFDVVIPMEDVMEIKGGRKQVVQKKVFPGYLLVKMIYDDDSWYVVRNTPGVTGFVSSGTGQKPTPLSRREVEKILTVKEEETKKPAFRLEFEEGDVVRIISGPFADFNGTISEINVDQSKVKVLVNIFDRETPVELSFDQVARV